MSLNKKGAVIFSSRYGSTRQYAEWIGQQLQIPVMDVDELYPAALEGFDYLVLGTPVYIGKMLIKGWLHRHLAKLQTKQLMLFVVCGTSSSERQKQEQIVRDNVPEDLIPMENIFFLSGRLTIRELSWKDRLMLKMGARLEKDPQKKAAMLHDIDGVKRENITGVVNSAITMVRSGADSRHVPVG
ncbi:flavodoxin domain-containing protein [Flavitalea sp. BT771]|uniref:flavodoxin domain-containing protein n=1 Tax=Flavitalea sp. BT771 TaxID=3063329 RepID=UPI0026E32669|nr:flavodoxin domain-containing protein [Flavitalea sp. BT771]MDO6429510.1 flavodoxin domain-containing protein [Flavitalea sp. BT771]MDV6218362.1 flavodoxin domain-containing protein [Flavitalea sp. BT771]